MTIILSMILGATALLVCLLVAGRVLTWRATRCGATTKPHAWRYGQHEYSVTKQHTAVRECTVCHRFEFFGDITDTGAWVEVREKDVGLHHLRMAQWFA